jgi:hypothetical protein
LLLSGQVVGYRRLRQEALVKCQDKIGNSSDGRGALLAQLLAHDIYLATVSGTSKQGQLHLMNLRYVSLYQRSLRALDGSLTSLSASVASRRLLATLLSRLCLLATLLNAISAVTVGDNAISAAVVSSVQKASQFTGVCLTQLFQSACAVAEILILQSPRLLQFAHRQRRFLLRHLSLHLLLRAD